MARKPVTLRAPLVKKLLVVISWACLAAVVLSARAQNVINPNNTIVRLDVHTDGTNFGHIDIELFDEEKPETVRNFLMYVYSGGYSNLIPHDLNVIPAPRKPGRFLEAGRVRFEELIGTNDIVSFDRTESFGSISNEFSRGPKLSNNFGTIAMVLRRPVGFWAGNMDWVLNLTNNAAFNTNKNYVVFGHVVNTSGPRTGTNLLNFFNTLTEGAGIRNVAVVDEGEQFYPPVTTNFLSRFPRISEMYLINLSIIQNGVARDTVAPTLQVFAPLQGGDVSTPGDIRFSGNATDNQRVARVIYDYGFPFQRYTADHTVGAGGGTNWAGDVELIPRTNDVFIRSVDDFGNVSEPVQRTFYYPFVKMNLEIFGKGKIIGLTNGQIFPIDTTNRFRAKPAPGQYFLGWRGEIETALPDILVRVNEYGNDLLAFFDNTFLGLVNGTYQGIFYPTNGGLPRNAGWISLNLTPGGRFRGVLNPIGSRYNFSGQFDTVGYTQAPGFRGTEPLLLQLLLYPSWDAGSMLGTYIDGTNVSVVLLYRTQKFDRNNPPPRAGTYSFVISPTQDTSVETGDGYGFGSLTIDATGRIRMSGTLGDEITIKQTGKLLKDNIWPFYGTASSGREAVVGWIQLTDGVFTSDVKWWAPHFPGNTNQNAQLQGSRYSNDVRLLNWTNGTITFSGGGLAEPVSADVTLNEDGTFTLPSNPNNVQLGLPNEKGQFSGTFNYPGIGTLTPLRGGTVQGSNIVAGSFGTRTNNGAFIIRQRP